MSANIRYLIGGLFRFSVGIFLPACSSAVRADVPSFTGVGDLPGGSRASFVYGLSADGRVVVGQSIGASGPEAFRWSRSTGIVGLGDLATGAFNSHAMAVSADGTVIVGQGSVREGIDDVTRATVWVSNGAPQSLGAFPGAPLGSYTTATAVSGDGSVVVGFGANPGGSQEAFRWTAVGGIQGIGFLPGSNFSSTGSISADGNTVTGTSSHRAFRWTQATGMLEIPPQPGARFTLGSSGVSADGGVIVGTSALQDGGFEAFRWTPSQGTVGLGWLPYSGSAPNSSAGSVSADGSIIVGMSSDVPFVWDQTHGIRNLISVLAGYGLDLTGWSLDSVTISADGRSFGGQGHNAAGFSEGWIATIPAPGPVALVGLLALAVRNRR